MRKQFLVSEETTLKYRTLSVYQVWVPNLAVKPHPPPSPPRPPLPPVMESCHFHFLQICSLIVAPPPPHLHGTKEKLQFSVRTLDFQLRASPPPSPHSHT